MEETRMEERTEERDKGTSQMGDDGLYTLVSWMHCVGNED